MRLRPYVVGAGNVGTGLALALREAGAVMAGVYNRSPERAHAASVLLGIEVDVGLFGKGLSEANVVLVAVRDEAVGDVGKALAESGMLADETVVAHTAGSLPAAALGDLGSASSGSLHPIVACTSPEQAAKGLVGAAYALEGDELALAALGGIVRLLQGRAVTISAAAKPRYHASLVLASNLLTALLHVALCEAEAAGFHDREAVLQLAEGAVDLVLALGPERALTGPLVRGDVATVERHLASLAPEARDVYKVLSLEALHLAAVRGLGAEEATRLAALLTAES